MVGRHTLVVMLTALAAGAGAGAAEPGPVEATWRARAGVAARRLATGGLDPCDWALEQAFKTAKPNPGDGGTLYPLDIQIEVGKLLVTYNYKGGQLDAFAVLALPSRWVLYQKAGSKTVRVVVGDSKCALSLCTTGPTSDGPCADDK